jgi:hypothetical protein
LINAPRRRFALIKLPKEVWCIQHPLRAICMRQAAKIEK